MPIADKEESKLYHKLRRRKLKDWFWKFKKTLKCNRCGFNHPAALHFHHLRDKKMEISKMIQRGAYPQTIMDEISKCEVLCANCHAIEHDAKFQETRN